MLNPSRIEIDESTILKKDPAYFEALAKIFGDETAIAIAAGLQVAVVSIAGSVAEIEEAAATKTTAALLSEVQASFEYQGPVPDHKATADDMIAWLVENLRISGRHFRNACFALSKGELVNLYTHSGGKGLRSFHNAGQIARRLGELLAKRHDLPVPEIPYGDGPMRRLPMA